MRLLFHQRARKVCLGLNYKIDYKSDYFRGMDFFKRINSRLDSSSEIGNPGSTFTIGVGTNIGVSVSGSGMSGAANTSVLLWNQSGYRANDFGSIFAFTTFSFAPTDSVAHYAFQVTNASGIEFSLTKYSDNNWYFGWNTSSDRRATGAATGTFTAGNSTIVGGTWDGVGSGGTNLWVNGKNIYSNGLKPAWADTSTAGVKFVIGNSYTSSNTQSWDATSSGTMHWIASWDRILTDNEIVFLSNNPMAFLLPFNEMSILQAQAAPSAIFRRTASRIGTRIGARQTWAA